MRLRISEGAQGGGAPGHHGTLFFRERGTDVKHKGIGISMRTGGRISVIIMCAIVSVCLPRTSLAGPTECQEAIDEYKSATSDISTALHAYADCVSNSGGHADCSTEFESLRSAQDDLESAVSNYESECN
jgi:hypothetical protein